MFVNYVSIHVVDVKEELKDVPLVKDQEIDPSYMRMIVLAHAPMDLDLMITMNV